jgi:hypothetical protein
MYFLHLDYSVAVIGSIYFAISTFFSRRRVYQAWAKVAALLVCIFGVIWGVTGLILIHWTSSISSHTQFILNSVRNPLGGVCIGLLICLIIAKPYKMVTHEQPQPLA